MWICISRERRGHVLSLFEYYDIFCPWRTSKLKPLCSVLTLPPHPRLWTSAATKLDHVALILKISSRLEISGRNRKPKLIWRTFWSWKIGTFIFKIAWQIICTPLKDGLILIQFLRIWKLFYKNGCIFLYPFITFYWIRIISIHL